MEFPKRKSTRHPVYDYNSPGYYFITICTKNKSMLLGQIVGRSLPDAPERIGVYPTEHPEAAPYIRYSSFGIIVQQQLMEMAAFYSDIELDKYVIMPNHIHLILHIPGNFPSDKHNTLRKNALVSRYIGTFKRFCNKKIGNNIWQTSFHDHVIRGEDDYQKIWMYIETNPIRWQKDCFYTQS